MKRLTTFEDIFNQLLKDYRGFTVEVETRQDGVRISCFQTTIDNIVIKPLDKQYHKKWHTRGQKVGLITIKERFNNNNLNIPFILGFNTMNAVFLTNGVTIKTLNLEFTIKKLSKQRKQLA